MNRGVLPQFWAGKKVFLTGHTGFKGGWISVWLSMMGARLAGFSLAPTTKPSLFDAANIVDLYDKSYIDNVCNLNQLRRSMKEVTPDIVIHMAAQPLVRYSYENPIETYATNVMGTLNLLEAVRSCPSVRAVVIVTTDKCYENREWIWGYRENESLGGFDPYSSSKACAELITAAYRQSFFSETAYAEHGVAIATARAGNVIGGGDWSRDRLVPDAIVSFERNEILKIRNPSSTRPWQHVLEPLSGYLVLAQALYEEGPVFNGAWNFGPLDIDTRSVGDLVELLIDRWETPVSWEQDGVPSLHEANFLKLDCSKAAQLLGWSPRWSLERAIESTVEWQRGFRRNGNVFELSKKQIESYLSD